MRLTMRAKASFAIAIAWMLGPSSSSARQVTETGFAAVEKWLIGDYLEGRENEGEPDRRGPRGREKERARAESGNAGVVLRPHDALPPDLSARELPRELASKLPPLPEGLERVLVDGQVALVEKKSRRIQDVFDWRRERGKGPPAELAVCHVPPGNPSRRKTLTLPEPAMRSHLEHGDYIGRCR